MEPPPDAYRDPVLKKNRAKRFQLFTRLLDLFGLASRVPRSTSLASSALTRKGKKTKRLILDARVVNWAFVSPRSVNLSSSEAMARIEVSLPEHVEEGSPDWHSSLERIELSLGLGDIQDCFHRYVLGDEFTSHFGVDTLTASSLSLAPGRELARRSL